MVSVYVVVASFDSSEKLKIKGPTNLSTRPSLGLERNDAFVGVDAQA